MDKFFDIEVKVEPPTLRQAAQQALEALKMMRDEYEEYACPACDHAYAAIYALRAALAEPVLEPVLEPVAWMIYTEGGTSAYVTDNPNDLVGAYRALALYTAPFQRKPLTEEEILSVLRLAPPEPSLWPHLKDKAVVGDVQKAVLAIARAIERAHGIGGSNE